METKITKGMSIIHERTISSADTGAVYGTGALEFLLSTPALVGMVIEASTKLLDPLVPAGSVTVGSRVETLHMAPTLLGESLHIILTVLSVDESKIHLEFAIHDHVGLIAKGTHERHIVESEHLLNLAYSRLGKTY